MNKTAPAQTIGQFIRQNRTARGLSLRSLAEQVGISAPFLSDIELDRRSPSPKVAKKIAEQLGLGRDLLSEFDYRNDLKTLAGLVRSNPELKAAFRATMQEVRQGSITAADLENALRSIGVEREPEQEKAPAQNA